MFQRLTPKVAATAAGALLLVPALSSCGFDYPTDRVYTPSVGVNERDGSVYILNAMIVSAQSGEGTFLATFANTDLDEENALVSLGGVSPVDFTPVDIPVSGAGSTNLADDAHGNGIKVTGELEAGRFVDVVLSFADGQSNTIEVPVVAARGAYAGLDRSGAIEDLPGSLDLDDDTETDS